MSVSTTGLRALRAVRSTLDTALLRPNRPIPSIPISLTSRLANSSSYLRPPTNSQKAYAFLPPLRSQPCHFLSKIGREARIKQQNCHYRQLHHAPKEKKSFRERIDRFLWGEGPFAPEEMKTIRERIKDRVDWFLWGRVPFPTTWYHYYLYYTWPFLLPAEIYLRRYRLKRWEEDGIHSWEERFHQIYKSRSLGEEGRPRGVHQWANFNDCFLGIW